MISLEHLPPLSQVVRETGLLSDLKHAKRLGQNFLLNADVLERVMRRVSFEDETVIEVGPGPGGLSREILMREPRAYIAIEKDPMCLRALEPLQACAQGRMQIHTHDATKVDLNTLVPEGLISVVSNLPYNVSTVLLTSWIAHVERIRFMRLMFQREVAQRIRAKVGTKAYGRLSILCQWTHEITHIMDLAPGAFTPAPKVFSSVLHFVPKQLSSQDRALIPTLESITQALFSKRRKMIRHSLAQCLSPVALARVFEQIDPTKRPEDLSVEQIVEIARIHAASKGSSDGS